MRAALTLLPCLLLVSACTPSDATTTTTTTTTAKRPDPSAPTGDAKQPTTTTGGEQQGEQQVEPGPSKADLIREAPGVDLSKLDEAQRESFFVALNTEASACGKPHSLAVSLRDDDECRDSMHVAQFIATRIAAGAAATDIKFELDMLVKALQPQDIPIAGRPVLGNERAPVTLVVFADFQCPMCRAEAPLLRAAVESHRGQVKLVFKQFPLTHAHARAEAAALAAEAAGLQGKFWEMHDKLFANQDAVTDADLERYAAEIGLDVAKWKADMASEPVKLAVAQDQADGMKLDLPGTPTVYVNGRQMVPMLWGGELDGWIDDALRR